MNPRITVTRKGPGANRIRERLKDLSRIDVLVGIPAKTTMRRGDEINNASLLFILTHGSPIRGIPATPVIEPAIQADGNKEPIALELKEAAKAALNEDRDKAIHYLNRAGMTAANASKAWFLDSRNEWPPNAPSTIKRKGSDRRNIDTGQLRRSLTWVVREVR